MFHFRDEKEAPLRRGKETIIDGTASCFRHEKARNIVNRWGARISARDKRGRGHSADLDNCRFDTFQYSVQQ
uniref:Uncharacterized protein n=1 Tax=Vespula pensylvanica TaxID=30213 RepID=A0A834PBF3_VESPE|nr:hypothetical protein H0235_003069 [Vespula pensylvanica]